MCLGKPPIRLWIALMVFFTTYINYSLRVNLSISIISMVQKHGTQIVPECKRTDIGNGSLIIEELTTPPATMSTLIDDGDTEVQFDWNENIQGLLLAAYFYGYVVASVPSGFMAEWIGPFKTIFYANVITAVFNSLLVFGLEYLHHWSVLFVARFIIGFMGGLMYPSLHCLISRWAPPVEKGKFIGALMGNSLGAIVTFPLVGYISERFGWDWSFHVLTIECIIFCVMFWLLVSDSPAQHYWISQAEKDYIIESHGGSVTTTKTVPPYFEIFKSVPFWALAVAHFGNLWGLYLQVTGAPKFIAEVLGFNLRDSGILAALPFMLRLILGFVFGSVGDHLRATGSCSVTVVRKSFILFSHLLPALGLLLITFVGCNSMYAIGLLAITQGLNGAAVVTNLQNSQDLAPNFAATIYGIISLIGGMSGFITPSVTGALIKHNNGIEEWQTNFLIGAIVYSSCGIVFILFGSGARQPWNDKLAEVP